jgi:hypothetical protein
LFCPTPSALSPRAGALQTQRLLAEHRLSRPCDRNDLVRMQRMRRRKHHGFNLRIGKRRVKFSG